MSLIKSKQIYDYREYQYLVLSVITIIFHSKREIKYANILQGFGGEFICSIVSQARIDNLFMMEFYQTEQQTEFYFPNNEGIYRK